MHGILLIVLFSFSAFYIAEFDFVKRLSFSPLIVGIILGMLYANSLRNKLPATWVPGIKFCSKQILRTGVVLYGFKLTYQQVVAIGLPAVTADIIIVCGTLLAGIFFGKLLKMDGQTALMTSTGSAICGAAAVLGAEPVVRCEPHKTAVAVSTVVIFGTLSMFLYPIVYRAGWLDGLSDQAIAVYVGSTLHEVAHVVGAGNAIDAAGGNVADAATITKMIRVILLAPVLVVMSLLRQHRRQEQDYHTMVRFLFSDSHRHQFPPAVGQLHSPESPVRLSGLHQQRRHVPAHHGHDRPRCGNEHRQIQTGRCKAILSGRYTLSVAAVRRVCHCEDTFLTDTATHKLSAGLTLNPADFLFPPFKRKGRKQTAFLYRCSEFILIFAR